MLLAHVYVTECDYRGPKEQHVLSKGGATLPFKLMRMRIAIQLGLESLTQPSHFFILPASRRCVVTIHVTHFFKILLQSTNALGNEWGPFPQ